MISGPEPRPSGRAETPRDMNFAAPARCSFNPARHYGHVAPRRPTKGSMSKKSTLQSPLQSPLSHGQSAGIHGMLGGGQQVGSPPGHWIAATNGSMSKKSTAPAQ